MLAACPHCGRKTLVPGDLTAEPPSTHSDHPIDPGPESPKASKPPASMERPSTGSTRGPNPSRSRSYVSSTRLARDRAVYHKPNPAIKAMALMSALLFAGVYVYFRLTLLPTPPPQKQHAHPSPARIVEVYLITPKPGTNLPPKSPAPPHTVPSATPPPGQ